MAIWLHEGHTPGYSVNWGVTAILHREITPFQELAIVETTEWGRALVLDGVLQTTEKDEFIYHEMMAHVAMSSHPDPRRVLIVGGGDGGVLREVLKHPRVERVDLVEIDRRVVELCREFLPAIACGFSDARANIVIADGLQYIEDCRDPYDVLIVDSSDPVGPAEGLFGARFYRQAARALKPGGMMVAQAESPTFFPQDFTRVAANMRQTFPIARIYLACVPTYVSGHWAFAIGSTVHDPCAPAATAPPIAGLRYYSPEVHRAAFVLPPYIRALLAAEAGECGEHPLQDGP